MGTEAINAEKEQEWIRKYRAALDTPSRKTSKLKALGASFGKVTKILAFRIRSVLTKRANTPNPATSAQATKVILLPSSTMPDRAVEGTQSLVVKSIPPGNVFHLDKEIPNKAS